MESFEPWLARLETKIAEAELEEAAREIARDNPRHQSIARLLENQTNSLVPLNRMEKSADELRLRLQ
jgi:hypothetical protein